MSQRDLNNNSASIIDITLYDDKKRAEFIGATVAKIAGFLNLVNPKSLKKAAEYLFVAAEVVKKQYPAEVVAKKYQRQNKKPCQRANVDKASR